MAKHKYLILLAMNGFLISLDQLTKVLIVTNFRLNQSRLIIREFFNLTLIHNPGAAFGLLATLPANLREPFFMVVPILTLLIILYAYYKLEEEQSLNIYALAMIVGGAMGNLIDRIRLGYVIDFLDFHWKYLYHFPAFNVADSAITIGVILLMIGMLLEQKASQQPSKG